MIRKRIFVYSEDVPVHRDVVANGLDRAGPPILRSIIDHIDGIAIYPVRRRYEITELDRDLAPLCTSMNRLPTILSKALRRYPALDFGFADALPAIVLAGKVRRSPADILFAFVGADHGMLTRAARLATLAGKSCVFYIVDDFLAPLTIDGAKVSAIEKAKEDARAALKLAKHVFTITDGLGDHLYESFGISSTTLGLAFEPEPRPTKPAKLQIIFVGSVNFLYAQGLHDLFAVVDRIRRDSGIDLKIRLTAPAGAVTRELGIILPAFVISAPAGTAEDLAGEIASSLFAFLPYSFNAREAAMVKTSFPSKSMEYFAYARSIVVYGPKYGVATKLFYEAALPSVVLSRMELEEAVHSHLERRPEHSVMYRKHLMAVHSLSAARRTLCADLGLEKRS